MSFFSEFMNNNQATAYLHINHILADIFRSKVKQVKCRYEEMRTAPGLKMTVDECKESSEHVFCVNLFYLLDWGGLQKVVEQSHMVSQKCQEGIR